MNSGTEPAQWRRTGTRSAANDAPARSRKPPKKPRRRAVSRTDVQSQIDRFTRLFEAQLKPLEGRGGSQEVQQAGRVLPEAAGRNRPGCPAGPRTPAAAVPGANRLRDGWVLPSGMPASWMGRTNGSHL